MNRRSFVQSILAALACVGIPVVAKPPKVRWSQDRKFAFCMVKDAPFAWSDPFDLRPEMDRRCGFALCADGWMLCTVACQS